MEYIKGLDEYAETQETAVTLGKFDGLHRGHQKLIECVKQHTEHHMKSVVFAFDMRDFYKQQGIIRDQIMTNRERRVHLQNQVDYLIECPFTEDIRTMEPKDFIRKVLVDKLHVRYIAVGSDYRFGYKQSGDVTMLQQMAEEYHYEIDVIEKERYGDRVISSSYVKEALAQGKIELVNELLGYPYSIMGNVIHGQKLGRTLGFPTMNIMPSHVKLLPPNGVYACKVCVDDTWYNAIGNLGRKPTVRENGRVLVEAFLYDYEGDAYGKCIDVRFFTFERPEQKFDSIIELKEQVDRDIAFGIQHFKDERDVSQSTR